MDPLTAFVPLGLKMAERLISAVFPSVYRWWVLTDDRAVELLLASEKTPSYCLDHDDTGLFLLAGGREFSDPADPARTAAYLRAFWRLVNGAFIVHESFEFGPQAGQHYLTHVGLEALAKLRQGKRPGAWWKAIKRAFSIGRLE